MELQKSEVPSLVPY